MYDVFCTGVTCCDLIFAGLEKFPQLGADVFCKKFMIKPGGMSNTPMGLAKLGLDSVFFTRVGTDTMGEIVYNFMEKTGLNMAAVFRDKDYQTAVSAVLTVGYERGFASYEDRSDKVIDINEIETYVKNSRHVHSSLNDCIKLPLAKLAEKHGKTLSIDAGWTESIKLDDLKHLLSKCTIFTPNEIEAINITGAEKAEDALEILSRYAKINVIKLGKKGCIAKEGDRTIRVDAVKEIKPVDTTGAGDLFNAGLIYGFLKGWKLERALSFANVAGGLAVTYYGGIDEDFTLERVNSLMGKYY
ncbi:MAG: carbohydrate kinase family protein [Clostridia bacterium]|nr:carbohydrate kinase family protein [Clostridia bacterium]